LQPLFSFATFFFRSLGEEDTCVDRLNVATRYFGLAFPHSLSLGNCARFCVDFRAHPPTFPCVTSNQSSFFFPTRFFCSLVFFCGFSSFSTPPLHFSLFSLKLFVFFLSSPPLAPHLATPPPPPPHCWTRACTTCPRSAAIFYPPNLFLFCHSNRFVSRIFHPPPPPFR